MNSPIALRSRLMGFTLLETTVVSALMSVLVLALAAAWSGFARPTADVISRCRVAQEANRAALCLAEDLGGSLPGAITGNWAAGRGVGRMVVNLTELWLCFDGGPSPNGIADWAAPDTVITYKLDGPSGNLIRLDQSTGVYWTVARNVSTLTVENLGSDIRITMTVRDRKITRTYRMIGKPL